MTKRKILALALTLSMVAILAIGGTLAYFTDTDTKTNVFTVGNVDITLEETFDPEEAHLIPATGSAQAGTLENGIEKQVWVTNNSGSDDAYVRVHIAIPAILDDGDPTYNASANTLHFNYPDNSVSATEWNWKKSADSTEWNAYKETIDNIEYNVYVVTYQSILEGGESTATKAMHQVYLDSKTTNEQIASINSVLGTNWKIHVFAEGAQADGFANAFDALNTAFGVPSADNNPWAE